MSPDERVEVKKVARELVNRLQQLLVLNWRQKSTARSQLKLAIEDTPTPACPAPTTNRSTSKKCSALFEHVFESYLERDAGVYVAAV